MEFLIICVFIIILSSSNHGVIIQNDYCFWEDFKPECQKHEVIVIKEALYGRMVKGRCVDDTYPEYLGCSSNVIGFLDSKCSGNRRCDIEVADKELKNNIQSDCPEAYLDLGFICQNVYTSPGQQCEIIKVRRSSIHLSSIITAETSCGDANNPWILEAQVGQKINLSLIDFHWKQRNSWGQKCQAVYGHIIDTDNHMVDICSDSRREKLIYTSQSNKVHLVMKDDAVTDTQFLIKVEAIGCPDIIPPQNAWLRKDENDITIGCHTSTEKWQLKCIGNHWIGVIGNCSQAPVPIQVELPQKSKFSGHHVSAFGIGCFALVVCCITVTVGIYFIRRYKIKLKSQDMDPMQNQICLIPKQTSGNQNTNTRTGQGFFSPNQTLNLHHQRPVGDNESAQYFVLERRPDYNENQI